MDLAVKKTTAFTQFSHLVNCLTTYLQSKRFQDVCVQHKMVERILSILRRSYTAHPNESSNEDIQSLAQLRLKINQALSDVSALPHFAEAYPLGSSLSSTLISWLSASEDQLQICACIVLGNLARSDEVCREMVQNLEIHKQLIAILKSDARGSVLHAALGVLKNLAIAGDNKLYLGDAGIIPAISRLWASDAVPQVQFSAASLARLATISSVQNISRLLESSSLETHPPAQRQTYLSLLLSLFEKTDSTPIKTEIGRTIASICRTLSSRVSEGNDDRCALPERLFALHDGVARPLWAMIVQAEWRVVRSEGWFALALMASNARGSVVVIDCLEKADAYPLLEKTIKAEVQEPNRQSEGLQRSKDRDNAIILVRELLSKEVWHPLS
jgi:hypothetical protein